MKFRKKPVGIKMNNVTIVLAYSDEEYPFKREELNIIDIGYSDKIYVVESQVLINAQKKIKILNNILNELMCLRQAFEWRLPACELTPNEEEAMERAYNFIKEKKGNYNDSNCLDK